MNIYIKNMLSIRCIMVVKYELEKLEIAYNDVKIGFISLKETLPPNKLNELAKRLAACELEIVENKKAILIEEIKSSIIEWVYSSDLTLKTNISVFLAEKTNYEYNYISNLFSEYTALTIEYYIMLCKIERVKELLLQEENTLTEISYLLNYSSVAHLSNQFKKITGLSPSTFRNLQLMKKQIA